MIADRNRGTRGAFGGAEWARKSPATHPHGWAPRREPLSTLPPPATGTPASEPALRLEGGIPRMEWNACATLDKSAGHGAARLMGWT